MVMGACPGQIPISCVPLTLMVTATVVRACRYSSLIFVHTVKIIGAETHEVVIFKFN